MPGSVFLDGDDVTLRTIEEEDLPFLRDTINDPAVRGYLGSRGPLNLEQEREYFEREVSDDGSVNLLVCVDGDPAGTAGLHPRTDVSGSSEVGLFLAEEYWGRGYGTETVSLVTGYGFRGCRRHRIEARVVDGNAASRRIFEKLDFRHEATLREAAFHDGGYADVHLYAVLAGEWFDGGDG